VSKTEPIAFGRWKQALVEFKGARTRLPKDLDIPGYEDMLKWVRGQMAAELEAQAERIKAGADE